MTAEINSAADDNVDAIAEQMVQLTAMLEKFAEQLAPVEAAHKELDNLKAEARKEYEARVYELNAKDAEFREALYEMKNNIRKVKADHESLERKLDQARRLEIAQASFADIEAKWEKLTLTAPWREWAFDYQISGAKKITMNKRMILADTMGLGKTLSALIALDLIRAATKDARPDNPYSEDLDVQGNPIPGTGVYQPCGHKILYFAPSTMLGNVAREVNRWAPHRSVVTLGGMTKAQRAFLIEMMQDHEEYVVLINYEAWRRDKGLIEDLINIAFDTVIIDEAHNVKDRKSQANRGIREIIRKSNGGEGVPFVIPMTGTPILNRPQELFSLLNLVDWRHFHSENYFLYDYCQQGYDGKWKFRTGGLEMLSKKISNLFLRRTKEQAGIKLPPKTVITHELTPDPEKYPNQTRAREEMRKWGSIILNAQEGKAISAAAAIAVYTRLRQIETWPAGIELKDSHGEVVLKLDIEESQKIDELIHYENSTVNEWMGLIPEVIEDERAVVFSMFKAPLRELAARCEKAGIKAVVLDGDTPKDLREEIMKDFDARYTPDRKDAKWDVILANYRVGGVGANFTAATQLFVLDSEWSPGKRDQAIDRVHRIGQDKPVTIHKLDMENTIDSWMNEIMGHKQDLIDGFENEAEKNLTDLLREGLDSGLI